MATKQRFSKYLRVLVTRPYSYGKQLSETLISHGIYALAVPLIKMSPIHLQQEVINQIASYDAIILISRSSAELSAHWLKKETLKKQHIFAVGSGTAKVLAANAIKCQFPNKIGSENLVKMHYFENISDKKILILKGKGGRNYLQEQIALKGAQVETIDLYYREPEYLPKNFLTHILETQNINTVIVTSVFILNILCQHADYKILSKLSIIVPSERIMREATKYPFLSITCSFGVNDTAMIKCLQQLEIKKSYQL